MLLVLLDAFHLGDPLFVSQLARDVAARKEGLVFVHGSGEAGERALEGRGVFPEARAGVWVTATPDEAAEVERATRDLNRRLVHEMNEAGVPAIRARAADRGLVVPDEAGGVRAGQTAWLSRLVGQGGVAVVASLVAAPGAVPGTAALVEVDAAQTAAVLAGALGAEAVVVLVTGRAAGIAGQDGVRLHAPLADAEAGGTLPDGPLVRRLVEVATVPVRAVSAASVRTPGAPAGTLLRL